MELNVQLFEIANLIFCLSNKSYLNLKSEQIQEIQNRFKNIIDTFQTSEKDYFSGFIKNNSKLPFNSITAIGMIGEQLILHFTYSYNEPIMMIFDTKNETIRNFIDLNQAKDILDDEIFMDIKENLMEPRFLNNHFKGISDINKFIDVYQDLLNNYTNSEAITGRDCFEININNLSELI